MLDMVSGTIVKGGVVVDSEILLMEFMFTSIDLQLHSISMALKARRTSKWHEILHTDEDVEDPLSGITNFTDKIMPILL